MEPVHLPLEREGYALREFADEDVFALCRLANDYEIWRWLSDLFPRPYDEAAAQRWLEEQLDYDPPRNLALVGPDGLVGGIGLNLTDAPNHRHDGEVGYWLGRPHWGSGLMSAALPAFLAWAAPTHGLRRFTARVYAGNDASVRVLERCGFRHEGVLRGAVIKEGQLLDMLVFGRLA